jgi:tetratricopeptide (TPR) repeat protein/predicted Ser/Thr protein kinase
MGDAKRCRWCGADLLHEQTEPTCARCRMSETLLRFSAGQPLLTATAAESAAESKGGSEYGEYRLLSEIASGGMGCVYRAHHRRLNRIVALKKMLPGLIKDEEQVRRFHTEAEAAAALSHPNIVPVYEIGEFMGEHFFTMALVEGQDLGQHLRGRSFSPQEAARHVHKVALAIHHAHQRGVLHRDLKPSNIILDKTNEPQIADFGIAKLRDTKEDSAQTTIVGTPHYMAPEQAQPGSEQVSVATDVYGLGAILYHLLTERPPFDGDRTEEVLWSVYYDEPVRPSLYNAKVPRDLEFICLKCLRKAPRGVFSVAEALAAALHGFLGCRRLAGFRASPLRRVSLWVSRNPAIAILVSLLGVALGSGAVMQGVTLQKVRAARAASETIIGFMNDGLSRDLREVGRLDLMEKVNAQAEQYYTNYTAVGDPGFWERKALFYENTASVEQEMGNLTRAEQAAKEADALYQQIYQTRPNQPHPLLRRSHMQVLLCNIAKKASRLREAEEFANSAVRLAETAVQVDTANPTSQAVLAFVLSEQASLWLEGGRTGPAVQNIDRAESTLQGIVQGNTSTPEWELWLANCGYYRGRADRARRNNAGALTNFNRYLTSIQHLVQRYSHNTRWQYELAVAYAQVGATLVSMKEFTAAEMYFKMNEAHAARLFSGDRRNAVWQSLYGQSLAWQARLAKEQGLLSKAREYLGETLTIQSNLVYRNPDWDPWLDDLETTTLRLAEAYELDGKLVEALPLIADWRAQCRRFALQNVEHFGHQRRWGEAVVKEAELRGTLEGTNATISLLQEGLAEVQSAPDSGSRPATEARIRGRLGNAFNAVGNPLMAAAELREALGLRLVLFERVPHFHRLRENIANNFRWTVTYLLNAGETNQALQLAYSALDWASTRLFPEEYRSEFGNMAVEVLRVLDDADAAQYALAKEILQRCLSERLAVPPPLSEGDEKVKRRLHESLHHSG